MPNKTEVSGCLFIGDPHIAGRCPDFRADDYPSVILEKVAWCLDYAQSNKLLPVFLGDLFDKPRDNPTWMIGRLIEILNGSSAIGIYGNHDCAEPSLNDNDSLMLLVKSNCLQLVSAENPWTGAMAGRPVLIGGSSYREQIPDKIAAGTKKQSTIEAPSATTTEQASLFDEPAEPPTKSRKPTSKKRFGIWITHHDLAIGDYEGGRFAPFAIGNVDLVVNGHIHRRNEPVQCGKTMWTNPGNISRRSRSEKCRVQAPAVMQLTFTASKFNLDYIEVPHQSFDDVFHEPVLDGDHEDGASAFVAGLSELRQRKTSSGAGLMNFLEKNIDQFSEEVGDEIMSLANDVTIE